MKYIRTFESYRTSINKSIEPVNEEIFGAIAKLIGNIFKKAKERINKTKGGKEIEAIYQKYLGMIDKELSKTAKVELNLAAAARANENPEAVPAKKESLNIEDYDKINEADAAADAPDAPDAPAVDAKTAVTQLKAKKGVLDQIVKKLQEMAMKEMDAVIKKMGGAAANPQLDMIIQSKKDQFQLDYLNAQITYLEQAGDKTESAKIAKERDAVVKKVEAAFKEFDTKKPQTYKEGDEVIYLLQGKTKEEWNKLTDDEKKKPTEGNAAKIVGVHKIDKIDGDKFTLLDKDDKPTINKTGAEIVGKPEGTEGGEAKYKAGDVVIFKRDEFDQAEWDALKDEDKSNPESEGVKKMMADGKVNSNTIDKVDGETLSFKNKKGVVYTKPADSVLTVVKK